MIREEKEDIHKPFNMKPGRISDEQNLIKSRVHFLDFQTFRLIFYAISYDETNRENFAACSLHDQTKKSKILSKPFILNFKNFVLEC